MKSKILSCLLAASTLFSAQPFELINSTSQRITLDGFGIEQPKNDYINLDYECNLAPHGVFKTEKNYNFVSVLTEKMGFQIRNIKQDTKIFIVQYDEGIEIFIKGIEDSYEIIPLYDTATKDLYTSLGASIRYSHSKHGNHLHEK